MRVTKFLFLVLLGFLTLARAQPAPGEIEQPGEEPQVTVDDIMSELRDDQNVDRDDQLDPQNCDPDLLEQLGDALMHKYFIISSIRSMAEDIAKGITGASPERQHVQLGLAYVSAKVLGIMSLLDGAAQSETRQFYEPSGGGGGGLPGDTGQYAEGDTGDEGGGDNGGNDSENSYGGSGPAGLFGNRHGAGGSGFGGLGLGGGEAEGHGGNGSGSYQGSRSGRGGSAGDLALNEGGASQGGYQGSRQSRGERAGALARSGSYQGQGGTGDLALNEGGASRGGGEGTRSGYPGSYRGRGGSAGGSPAGEALGASQGGYRGASPAGRSGGRNVVGGAVPELFGQLANARWILLVAVLLVLGTITVTFIRIARFFRRRTRRQAPGLTAPVMAADPALTLLKERFVKDEITKEEFEKKEHELEEVTGAPAKPDHKHKHPESKPPSKDVGGDVMQP